MIVPYFSSEFNAVCKPFSYTPAVARYSVFPVVCLRYAIP